VRQRALGKPGARGYEDADEILEFAIHPGFVISDPAIF
jgi:hypothetical protein